MPQLTPFTLLLYILSIVCICMIVLLGVAGVFNWFSERKVRQQLNVANENEGFNS